MAVRKLVLDDFIEEDNFTLIGIHCVIEDYRLAYLLNKALNIGLQRRFKDLTNSNKTAAYSLYEWKDTLHYNMWNLVANNCKVESKSKSNKLNLLFSNYQNVTKSHQLVPEFKKANYLLKIEDSIQGRGIQNILKKVLEISQIITAYIIETNQLKSKDNLIFN